MKPHCHNMPCRELRERLPFYLMKSELLRHLRDEHARWWRVYDHVYDRGQWKMGPDGGSAAETDYSDAAKEILTRCRMYDTLFNHILTLKMTEISDFGNYCKLVFQEIGKLKPAFPESAAGVGVFDEVARDMRKFVMQQHDRWAHRLVGDAEPEPALT